MGKYTSCNPRDLARKGRFCLVVSALFHFFPSNLQAQESIGVVKDEIGFVLPFVMVTINGLETRLTSVEGKFPYTVGDTIHFSRPDRKNKTTITSRPSQEFVLAEDQPNASKQLSDDQVLHLKQKLKDQDPLDLDEFDFQSNNQILLLQNEPDAGLDAEGWEQYLSVNQITQNRYVHKNKWYSKVLASSSIDAKGRASEREWKIPLFVNNFSLSIEYLQFVEDRFYNPLYPGSENRYNYFLTDTILNQLDTLYFLTIRPKPNKKFKALECEALLSGKDLMMVGYTFETVNHSFGTIRINSSYVSLGNHNTVSNKFVGTVYLPRYPNRKSSIKVFLTNELKNFQIPEEMDTTGKKIGFAILGEKKDTTDVSRWEMDKLDDEAKNLDYIHKDTTNGKFTMARAANLGVSISDGNLAYKLGFLSLSNVFGLNQFEGLRVGLSLATREEFSEKLLLTGYGAYGFSDQNFKYGGGLGYKIGKKQKTVLGITSKQDLREPTRIQYKDDVKDLFRNFFASRMDLISSQAVFLSTKPNNYTSFLMGFESYTLSPQYDYVYKTSPTDSTFGKFYFSDFTLSARFGVSKQADLGFSQLFINRSIFLPVLYLQYQRGFEDRLDGNYAYNKLSSKITFDMDIEEKGELHITGEMGIMTSDTPYQLLFGAPGSHTALGSIIVKDAFQTMELYRFVADRFISVFSQYYFGKKVIKPGKFNPRLGLAWSAGWGLISGNINIHEGIMIQDYPEGYFEAGLIFDNLLAVDLFRYIYSSFGVGVFYGMGKYVSGTPFAIRLTYDVDVN